MASTNPFLDPPPDSGKHKHKPRRRRSEPKSSPVIAEQDFFGQMTAEKPVEEQGMLNTYTGQVGEFLGFENFSNSGSPKKNRSLSFESSELSHQSDFSGSQKLLTPQIEHDLDQLGLNILFDESNASVAPPQDQKQDTSHSEAVKSFDKELESISRSTTIEGTSKQKSSSVESHSSEHTSEDDPMSEDEVHSIYAKIERIDDKINKLKRRKNALLMKLPANDPKRKEKEKEGKEEKAEDALTEKAEQSKNHEQVDSIAYMKKGTAMLKYGRYGYPHFRQFELSQDGEYLVWYSEGKSMDETRILVRDINEIHHGQLTPTFRRHLQPRLSKCSFSLIYDDGLRSLDVITKSKGDFLVWTAGLKKLVSFNKKHFRSDDKLEHFYVSIPKRNIKQIEKRLSLQPDPPQYMVDKELNNARKQLVEIKQLCLKVSSKHPQLVKVQTRLVELEAELENAVDTTTNKPLSVASHEIWRTAVELKALKNKVKVLIKCR